MCRKIRHTLLEAIRDSLAPKAAIAGGILFGLLTTSALAQQTPGWSPQPYSRPVSAETQSSQPAIPTNSLRATEASKSGDVVRWGKVTVAAKPETEKRSFSDVLPKASQPQSADRDDVQELEIRQSSTQSTSNRQAFSEPRTGFGRSAPAKQSEEAVIVSRPIQRGSEVQLASFSEGVENTPAPVEKSNRVWRAMDGKQPAITLGTQSDRAPVERPQGTTVQKARYQEPQPILPGGLLPDPLPPANDPALSKDKADSILEPSLRSQVQQTKPKSSVLEPEQIPPSPFPSAKPPKQDNLDRSPSDDKEPPALGSNKDRDPAPPPPKRRDEKGVDCDAVRLLAKDLDIKKIAIDSSPDFVKGIPDRRRPSANTKEAFVASAESRPWIDYDGNVVAQGKLVDMRLGMVIIETSEGTRTKFLLDKLCDADKAYVSEKWGLPVSCSIDDRSFPSRDFTDSTVTWKASGACHKPLYFEDVQLERYGHEWGPVVQPFMSTAHFFGDVVVLPYKMGIHPMNECQYSLGYYRPGSCAPWTVGPVPISLRGALMQGKVITGTALMLP